MRPSRRDAAALKGSMRNVADGPEGALFREDAPGGSGPLAMLPAESGSLCGGCRSGQKGLSLVELVLGLALVAILAAVGVARYSNLNSNAIADGETLKATLRYVHTRAMSDIYTWELQVDGVTCTVQRNAPTPTSYTLTFVTAGVEAGTTTFDNRGVPSGKSSYAVTDYPGSPVTITTGTGFVP